MPGGERDCDLLITPELSSSFAQIVFFMGPTSGRRIIPSNFSVGLLQTKSKCNSGIARIIENGADSCAECSGRGGAQDLAGSDSAEGGAQ